MSKNEVEVEAELARIDALYAVSLRDYFSTFAAYATATSILLAGVGVVVSTIQSPWLVALLTLIGLYLCLQWHISTTSMRDQYTHFYIRMVRAERHLGHKVMLRWHDAANAARHRSVLSSSSAVAAVDQKYLTWSFRHIDSIWALRGAVMPAIYSSVFVAIGVAVMLKGWSRAGEVAALVSVVWLIVFNILIFWEHKSARSERVFAYGSNMCSARLCDYSVTPQGPGRAAVLEGYRLLFNKKSHKDGSGKANVESHPNGKVWGVVYTIPHADLKVLDAGEGPGYSRKKVPVHLGKVEELKAWVYVARQPSHDAQLRPYTWYKRFLVEGAREHNLPDEYVAELELIEADQDQNHKRDGEKRALKCAAE